MTFGRNSHMITLLWLLIMMVSSQQFKVKRDKRDSVLTTDLPTPSWKFGCDKFTNDKAWCLCNANKDTVVSTNQPVQCSSSSSTCKSYDVNFIIIYHLFLPIK